MGKLVFEHFTGETIVSFLALAVTGLMCSRVTVNIFSGPYTRKKNITKCNFGIGVSQQFGTTWKVNLFFLSSKSLHPSVHCVQWRPTCFNWNTKHTVPAAEGANVEGEESGGAKSRAKLCKKVGWYSES